MNRAELTGIASARKEKEKENHVGSEALPHQLRKTSHLGPKYCMTPSPPKKKVSGDQGND